MRNAKFSLINLKPNLADSAWTEETCKPPYPPPLPKKISNHINDPEQPSLDTLDFQKFFKHKLLGWFWKAILLKNFTWGIQHLTYLICIFPILLNTGLVSGLLGDQLGYHLGSILQKQLLSMWPDWAKPALQVLNIELSDFILHTYWQI